MFNLLSVTLAIAVITSPIYAAELPRSGSDAYTTYYINQSINVMKLGNRTIANFDTNGISRNDKGDFMFHNMTVRCLGQREVNGDEPATVRGMCVDMDKDGDKVFSTFDAKGSTGVHEFIGGTGKYTGMSGTADYSYNPLTGPEGKIMNVVPHQSKWTLPGK